MHPITEAILISEDDDLRSRHIRKLVQTTMPIYNSFEGAGIPRSIVQFWHDLNDIPIDVQDCLDSWEILKNKGFTRALFDNTSARKFISMGFGGTYVKAFDRCHHPAMRCDYFRLCYILKEGGFYVDADEIYQGTDCSPFFRDNKLKMQPLCYDIATGTMIKPKVFMSYHEFSPDWIFYVNNNPLIAASHHPVIQYALERATSILLSSEKGQHEIQSTTGPGNLSASLVRHSININNNESGQDFLMLPDWEATSISPWELGYRKDDRNWRLWNSSEL